MSHGNAVAKQVGADGRFLPDQRREEFLKQLPDVVARYLRGESIQVIAKEQQVTRRTIYNWMLGGLGDEAYRELVTECLVARVADADEELEAARSSRDPVRVSAARETCRFVRMDLERRRPGLYGPKQEVTHTGAAPSFTVVLLDKPSGGGKPREVDVTPVPGLTVREVAGLEENKEKAIEDEKRVEADPGASLGA